MFNPAYLILSILIGIALGVVLSVIYRNSLKSQRLANEKEKKEILDDAKKAAETTRKDAALEAKELVHQAKAEVEKEVKERRYEAQQLEKRLRQKEENLDRKHDQIEKREHELNKREKEFNSRERSLQDKENTQNQLIKDQMAALERIAGISAEEAKQEILNRVEQETRFEAIKLAKRIEDEEREFAEKKAREIVGVAIQRYASDYVSEATVTSVTLSSDEMKGRIIGREGRNIRAIEAATGVDLIVDDTPEVITLSGFDPVRREIARLSLEKLMADGRIHPTRIEEVVEKIKRDVDITIKEEGEKAIFDLGLSGIHPEIVRLIGRLKYRTSYGQNILQHSREVAYLAGMMAAELKADVKLAKRGGLLHDIGKAIDHEVEGSHQEIGTNFAKKYGENAKVLNAIAAHHGECETTSVESALVAAADALSAARPGVRRESIENYLKRLEKLEQLAMSYKGVEKCYAIQAGREVRIIVKPEDVTDESAYTLSKDLSKKIEAEMSYPGQIKVTVIRESRFVEYAK